MLTTIELRNYRGFQDYRLSGLSRVNLLVGKNNCGKTSVLEAVHLLASGGNHQSIDQHLRWNCRKLPERRKAAYGARPVFRHHVCVESLLGRIAFP